MVNHREMLIKQFGFILLITSLFFIYSTHSIYAMTVKRMVFVYNQTDYDFYFICDKAEGEILAHSSDKIWYSALLPEDMFFWINDYSGGDDIDFDDIDFTVTLEPYPDKYHDMIHTVIIMTDEQGEIVCDVEIGY